MARYEHLPIYNGFALNQAGRQLRTLLAQGRKVSVIRECENTGRGQMKRVPVWRYAAVSLC